MDFNFKTEAINGCCKILNPKINSSKKKTLIFKPKLRIFLLTISLFVIALLILVGFIMGLVCSLAKKDNSKYYQQNSTENKQIINNSKDQIKPEKANIECKSNASSLVPSLFNKNECPFNSLYVPSFLTIENSYLNGFPINQEIACHGTKIILNCPQNHFIYLLSAYYGIQSETTTSCIITKNGPKECYREETSTSLIKQCEKNTSCIISINSNNYGDPCIGYRSKQMMIQFQCLDLNTFNRVQSCSRNLSHKSICPVLVNSTKKGYEQKWCEPTLMSISCNKGYVIQIMCSFYGIDPKLKCDSGFYTGSPTSCYFDSFSQVNTTCSGHESCSIDGNPSFERMSNFKNACSGYSNMLYVQWECVASKLESRVITKINNEQLDSCFWNSSYSLVGTCPTFSRYEPEFLTSPTSSSFGFPIYEKLTCNGGKVVIKCLNSFVIHILSAYFGVQIKAQNTSCIQQSPEQILTKCFYPSAYTKIAQICEHNNECELKATSYFFNTQDICPTYSKQLVLQYQCLSSNALNTIKNKCSLNNEITFACPEFSQKDLRVNQNTWCSVNNGSIIIKCKQNQKIDVYCSFYGLHPSIKECSTSKNSPICYFDNSIRNVKKACNGLQSCSIQFSSLADPCIGLDKIFHIQWQCK